MDEVVRATCRYRLGDGAATDNAVEVCDESGVSISIRIDPADWSWRVEASASGKRIGLYFGANALAGREALMRSIDRAIEVSGLATSKCMV